jgi:hypothetical protein
MVRDRFVDLSDDTGQLDFDGWRCLNCGEIIDALILQHRRDRHIEAYRSHRRWASWVPREWWQEAESLNRTTPSQEAQARNMPAQDESGWA